MLTLSDQWKPTLHRSFIITVFLACRKLVQQDPWLLSNWQAFVYRLTCPWFEVKDCQRTRNPEFLLLLSNYWKDVASLDAESARSLRQVCRRYFLTTLWESWLKQTRVEFCTLYSAIQITVEYEWFHTRKRETENISTSNEMQKAYSRVLKTLYLIFGCDVVM